MNSLHLIDKTAQLWDDLQKSIKHLEVQRNSTLEYAQYALMETDEAIRTVKEWVIRHDFDSWENEIRFFKDLKPHFIAKFIYFSKVVSLLSSLPASGTKHRKKMFEHEFQKLQDFYLENRDFVSYFHRKATYLDVKYFLRFKYDLDVPLAPDFHSYDERFSTSHDHLAAAILANDEFERFLLARISQLKEPPSSDQAAAGGLQWTASKVALTELIFALHHTNCFNAGQAGLAETVKWFENHLETDLGNYHKTLGEIRARKTPQNKFLQLLTDNLTAYLDSLDT